MAGGGTDYLGFHKSSRKVWASWALPLNKRVGVSACKIRKPHTHVFVPTHPKSFLDDLLENKKSEVPPLSQTTHLKLSMIFSYKKKTLCNPIGKINAKRLSQNHQTSICIFYLNFKAKFKQQMTSLCQVFVGNLLGFQKFIKKSLG